MGPSSFKSQDVPIFCSSFVFVFLRVIFHCHLQQHLYFCGFKGNIITVSSNYSQCPCRNPYVLDPGVEDCKLGLLSLALLSLAIKMPFEGLTIGGFPRQLNM